MIGPQVHLGFKDGIVDRTTDLTLCLQDGIVKGPQVHLGFKDGIVSGPQVHLGLSGME